MISDTLTHIAPEDLAETLRDRGYRVEIATIENDQPVLRSATGGLGFSVRFANPVPGREGAFADATFQTLFRVQGDLPLSLVNQWNLTRRFTRLFLASQALVLEMDVSALGGVEREHLRAQSEIWDRLVQELMAFLHAELPKLAKAAPRAEPEDEPEQPAA